MSYGKSKINPNLKLYTFEIRTKDKAKQKVPVFFEVAEKIGDKYEVQKDEHGEPVQVKFVSGTLTGLEHSEHTWAGPTGNVLLQKAKAFLRDGDNLYVVNIKYDILGRSIINALVNLKSVEDVEISVYMSKKVPSYPAAIVRQGDKRADWKYAVDQIPKPTEVPFKGTIIRDYSAVDAFFINEVKTFGATLGATRAVPAQGVAPAAAPTTEDVPF